GVAREGVATEFPTGLGIAATWNRDLVSQVTAAISDEARVKTNDCLAQTPVPAWCKGLTYWSPTINLNRDPRWGRADESYGEDPFLSGEIAGQFVLGLQGGHTSNPDSVGGAAASYLKAVSTPKHYLANNSEINRHNGTSNLSDRSLHEYYTAAFAKAAGKEYGAKSVMPSYNSINVNSDYASLTGPPTIDTVADKGTPAPASKYAIETLLRRIYGFDGFITSDCGAVDDVFQVYPSGHSWQPSQLGRQVTPAEGSAWALKAGTDVDCMGTAYPANLPTSQNEGLTTEQDWDVALTRAFTIRMQLGEFDDAEKVPYRAANYTSAGTSAQQVGSDAHLALAHQMSLEAPALLKNSGALPLSTSAGKTTVVLGYYGTHPIHGGYSPAATAGATTSAASEIQAIAATLGGTVTVKDDAISGAVGSKPTVGAFQPLDSAGAAIAGSAVAANTFDPISGWSIRPNFSGTPTFYSDLTLDGEFNVSATVPSAASTLRLTLSGTDLVGDVAGQSATCASDPGPGCETVAVFAVTIGATTRTYSIYHQNVMGANSNFTNRYVNLEFPVADFPTLTPGAAQTINFNFNMAGGATPGLNLTPADETAITAADNVIVYVGTRESDSNEEQDRTSIALPRFQADLAKRASELNPKTVVWIQSVGQVDLSEFKNEANAIIWSTYNGQFQGKAAAELLFNQAVDIDANPSTPAVQANPSGKLTFTAYSNVDTQLTDSMDYRLTTAEGATCGRTYWYYKATGAAAACTAPDYVFGHGLSYTTFAYGPLALSAAAATPNDTVNATVTVTNSGTVPGRETVELYATSPSANGDSRPFKQLKGFAKTAQLAPGASETVTIPLKASDLWFWDNAAQKRIYDAGAWRIQVGGTSADVPAAQTATLSLSGARKAGVDVVAAIPDGVQLNVKTPNNA
ncbi:MAG: glycoside hydrolase family 3 C-terminal domain-containing protein, partial [Bifidobacteriaceae bacterium]|nr:glycoside hydrolase family 3 C-terminal domain-containing protein [Bifidobacteriaceae bacterium]